MKVKARVYAVVDGLDTLSERNFKSPSALDDAIMWTQMEQTRLYELFQDNIERLQTNVQVAERA